MNHLFSAAAAVRPDRDHIACGLEGRPRNPFGPGEGQRAWDLGFTGRVGVGV